MTAASGVVIALAAVFLSLFLKSQQKEIATLLVITASVVLFCIAVKDAGSAVASVRETVADSGVAVEVETLLKALGIAVITQITADICREAGETIVAGQVEMIGKMEIVLLSLPLAAELLTLAKDLLV
ncbi:MAG: hypothetical protein J6S41_05855 [Clostridia bacterium]|nr:hypothetical protein [Clostridia bacterium]